MSIVTEIVKMKSIDGITKEEFIAVVDGLEKDFHAKQPGFIDTELLFDQQNEQWLMIQHWQSKEELHAASKQMFSDSAAEPFVKSLLPQSVKMTIVPQIKTWGKIMKRFAYEVETVSGYCACGYKVGDIFQCEGMNTPDLPFCGGAYMALFPIQVALHNGARFAFEDNPKSKTGLTCPDNGYVTFRVTLLD